MSGIHFVSDVHLKDGEPVTWEAFFSYLEGPAQESEGLYLLGDIFHAWIGDDDDRPLAKAAKEKLSALVRSGCPVRFIFGNHDFMVGRRFGAQTGVEMLGESTVLETGGRRFLLLHGDTLCTGDVAFLKARAKVTSPRYLFFARMLPKKVRIERARQLLEGSDPSGFYAKDVTIDEQLACKLLEQNRAQVMVHGHDHLPGEYGLPCGKGRWSLPSWNPERKEGGWLVVTEEGLRKEGPWAGQGSA